VPPEVAFNTAVSFASNTNWQAYGGETTLSYLTQMLGLTVQNFVSAATGMAVLVALIRGFVRKRPQGSAASGSTHAQHALRAAAALARAGAGARLAGRGADASTAGDGASLLDATVSATAPKAPSRSSRSGPAASQIAIKQLGTNGGGFFNVNSAHPFENPTPLSNFLECSPSC
jgi:K+-transporting ATPase ATPase A chain